MATVLLLVIGVAWLGLSQGAGPPSLSQDDGYVHLAVAKTLRAEHVWGIDASNPHGASSSPLWVVLLALVPWSSDDHGVIAAMACALVAAASLAGVAAALVRSRGASWLAAVATGLAVTLAGRGLALIPTGLEHNAFAVLAVLLAAMLGRPKPNLLGLSTIIGCACLLRPEGSFLVAGTLLVAAKARDGRMGLAAISAAVAASAVMLSAQAILGGGVVPATTPDPALMRAWGHGDLLSVWVHRVVENLRTAWPLALATFLLIVSGNRERGQPSMLFLVAIVILQLTAGRTGNYFRYEAWVYALLAFCALDPSIRLHGRSARAVTRLAAAMSLLAGVGPMRTSLQTVTWQRITHGEVARALRDARTESRIATPSAGEIAFRSPGSIVDTSCRTTLEVYELCRQGSYSAVELQRAALQSGATLAYAPRSFAESPDWPGEWTAVETWNRTTGDLDVDFTLFAVGDPHGDDVEAVLSQLATERR